MSMQTLTWDVDAAAVAAVAGNSDAYSLALATQARQKLLAGKQYRTDDEVISAVEDFFWGSGWVEVSIPSAATLLEEVCGPQGRLWWNIFWSNLTIAS